MKLTQLLRLIIITRPSVVSSRICGAQQITNPLILKPLMDGTYQFVQPEGFIDTRGIETNIKFTYNKFKLFIGYTLADVNQHYTGIVSKYPLVAKHRLNNVLMYEIEEKLKIGWKPTIPVHNF